MAAIATQAVYGDGSFTAEEQDALRATLGEFPELWEGETMDSALKVVGDRVRRQGIDAVFAEAVATVPRHLQQPLLVTMRGLVNSDGAASADENDLLAALNTAFGPARKAGR